MIKYNTINIIGQNNKIQKSGVVRDDLDDLDDLLNDADEADEADGADESFGIFIKKVEETLTMLWCEMVDYRLNVFQAWEEAIQRNELPAFEALFNARAVPRAGNLETVLRLHKLVGIEFFEELKGVSKAALALIPTSNLLLALSALHAYRKVQSGSWTSRRYRLTDIIFDSETLYLVVEGDDIPYDLQSMTTTELDALLKLHKLAPASRDAISHAEGSAA